MGRPSKYATAQEAAENSLYSKMGGPKLGLSLFHFILKATSKCDICGREPGEGLSICRKDDSYFLAWNYVLHVKTEVEDYHQTTCGTCKKLAKYFDVDYIVKHCARIMAKRMHDKRRESQQFLQSQDKLTTGRSGVG